MDKKIQNKFHLHKIRGIKKCQWGAKHVSRPLTTIPEKKILSFSGDFFSLGDKPFKNYKKSKYFVPSKNFPVSTTRNFCRLSCSTCRNKLISSVPLLYLNKCKGKEYSIPQIYIVYYSLGKF